MIRDQKGFTIPELIVTLIMTSILTGIIMFFAFNYWQYSYILQADIDTFTERLNASDYLREALGNSSGIITQNSIPDNNTGSPDTSITSGLYWTPVHAVPGNIVIGTGSAISPLFYYKRISTNTSNQVVMNGTQPYEDEYVVYLDAASKSLKIRTLANPSVTNNKVKTSCPPANATSACPADKILIADIASVDKRFFSRSGNLIDWTSVYDSTIGQYIGPDNSSIEVFELTLNVSKKAIFQKSNTTQSSTVIRIALRNT